MGRGGLIVTGASLIGGLIKWETTTVKKVPEKSFRAVKMTALEVIQTRNELHKRDNRGG